MEFDEEVLNLLGEGDGMDFEWLLDAPPAEETVVDHSPTRSAPLTNLSAVSRSFAKTRVDDRSATSRFLATTQDDLADISAVSRSFALDPTKATTVMMRRQGGEGNHVSLHDVSGVSRSAAGGPPRPREEQQQQQQQEEKMRNMSAISHNLAHVGALPQCNQAHAAPSAPPPPVAEEVLVGGYSVVATLLVDDDDDGDAATVDGPPPRKKGFRRKQAPQGGGGGDNNNNNNNNNNAESERIESRRAKNREAAERMRRRRREEHDDLERAVCDLSAKCADLAAKLAISEAHNAELRELKGLPQKRDHDD